MGSLNALTGTKIYLDANVIIYAVEGFPGVGAKLASLFQRFDRGELRAVTSELSLAEVLVKPLRHGKGSICDTYRRMLQTSAALLVAPVDRFVLLAAAQLRADSTLRLPDAIHAATAASAGCTTFLTNDQQFQAVGSLPVMLVTELP